MLCYVEGYAYCLATCTSHHNLNVYLTALHVLAEDPHLSQSIQLVNQRALNVIFNSQTLYDHSSVHRNYFQFLKCLSVLSSVITVDDAKDLHLGVELIEKTLFLVFAYHTISHFGAKVINPFELYRINNFKVAFIFSLGQIKVGNWFFRAFEDKGN